MVALILSPVLGCGGNSGPATENQTASDSGDAPTDGGVDGGIAVNASSLCGTDVPTGNQVGQQFPSLELTTCDGQVQTLENLCEARASWMFVFAGW